MVVESKSWRRFGAALPGLALVLATPFVSAQEAGPFAGLTGAWSGSGSIAMTDGSNEKIRCRANYSVPPSGEKLHLALNCASDSYRVQVISNVVAQGDGSLSGSWRETTRQAEGTVSGRVAGEGVIQASLDGTGFSAQLALSTRGNSQAISIRSEGTDIQSIRLELRRG